MGICFRHSRNILLYYKVWRCFCHSGNFDFCKWLDAFAIVGACFCKCGDAFATVGICFCRWGYAFAFVVGELGICWVGNENISGIECLGTSACQESPPSLKSTLPSSLISTSRRTTSTLELREAKLFFLGIFLKPVDPPPLGTFRNENVNSGQI